jgi:purine-nucleoside phosphorylase
MSLAIVAGSGLSGLASILEVEETIPFEQIPGVGAATVAGHSGKLLHGTIDGHSCQLLLGRRHFYEGDDRPIGRLIDFVVEAGATALLVTSAAGALQRSLRAGELVVIHDFIDLQNREARAVRDEQRAHSRHARGIRVDAHLTRLFEEAATAAKMSCHRGVSACTSGPTYESPMDVEFLQYTGAIVATMSGAPEVTRANQIGLPAMAVAVVTNPCTGIDASVPSHAEVLEASAKAAVGLGRVIRQFVSEL